MDDKEYSRLLDKAYSELPTVLYKNQRFEVPQVRGRLVRSRTVVSNFKDIAKQLAREKDHLAKFMLKELGVRGEVDSKEELVLHSRFQPAMLNKAVENYFLSYVKCPNCNGPDTELIDNMTKLKCKACGHVASLGHL